MPLKLFRITGAGYPMILLHEIAQLLDISNEEVDGVATFYSRIYRKPVGRNVILICDGISCMIMGYGSLYDYISKSWVLHSGRQHLTTGSHLLPISCLGDCDQRTCNDDKRDHYNSLTTDKIDDLLAKYK